MNTQGFLNIATRAARSAGNHIAKSYDHGSRVTIETKGHNDYVTEVDQQAEGIIIETLGRAYPEHGFLGEETGIHNQDAEFQWIIDPLDGTTNFIHGNPQFAVSIALQHEEQLLAAVIYDPIRQELFTASKGGGAMLDGRRLRLPSRRELSTALVGTGLPFSDFEHLSPYMAMLRAMIRNTAGIRRPGSAALDLAWLAAGRLDGFWELGLKPWDMAAGALLVREAGGLVGDVRGDEGWMESGNIVAGCPKVYTGMLKLIAPHVTPAMMSADS